MKKCDLFKYFHSSPEIIRLAVMMYARFPLSLRNVEDLLNERGIDINSRDEMPKRLKANSEH
jgi:putative transposase